MTMTTTKRNSHFHGSHYAALHSSGPLSFLNPTTRYHLIQVKEPGPRQEGPQSLPSLAASTRAGSLAPHPSPGPGQRTESGRESQDHDRLQVGGGGDEDLSSSSPRIIQGPVPVLEEAPVEDENGGEKEEAPKKVYHVWRSRDNRKGRHAAIVEEVARAPPGKEGEKGGKLKEKGVMTVPSATNTLAETWKGIVKMIVRWPVWDVSFDVAVVFTIGSVIWVVNGSFVLLPFVAPWTEFPNESDLGGGVTACIGATIFEFGSVLYMLEAVNENRSDCFGWALEEALEDPHGQRLRSDDDNCRHHHHEKRGLLHAAIASATSLTSHKDAPSTDNKTTTEHPDTKSSQSYPDNTRNQRRWSWWPTRHELTTHYLRDIGFLACLSQMIGATVFWISGFTGLPPIYNALERIGPAAVNGVYWLPQVIGGTGFIVSSGLFMLEVQEKWYKPALGILGWHVGVWNLVGAIGFTLCGALGFGSQDSSVLEYGSLLATYVGSWAFLIGSVIQWYESLDKYPISVGAIPPSLRDDKHHNAP